MKMGFVFQGYNLFRNKTALDNVLEGLTIARKNSPEEAKKKAMEMLEKVGMADRASFYPDQLSGGQQQRVAIARAIVNQPKVLIADEPTGNLDPETSQGIIELLERINDVRQTTVLVVTHDREIVQRNKKRTILIEDGCVTTDTSLGGYQSWNS